MEAVVQQAIESQVLRAAVEVEQRLDAELANLEKLTDDDLEELRRKRLEQLQRDARAAQDWRARGHGEYTEIASEKDFFAEIKQEERAVCHFYRESWPCKVMDKHLELLSKKHLETKFIKIHAEKAPFLAEKLKIWMLPTVALIKSEKILNYIVGLDEFGGEDFPTALLAARLARDGIVKYEQGDEYQPPAPEAARNVRRGGQAPQEGSDEDSDFD